FKRLPILVIADNGAPADGLAGKPTGKLVDSPAGRPTDKPADSSGNKPGDDKVLRRPFEDSVLLAQIARLTRRDQKPATESRPKKATGKLSRDDVPTEPIRAVLDAHLQQQLAELKTLSNLARSISSVLELGEVLN